LLWRRRKSMEDVVLWRWHHVVVTFGGFNEYAVMRISYAVAYLSWH
jgi:hypothetical protein